MTDHLRAKDKQGNELVIEGDKGYLACAKDAIKELDLKTALKLYDSQVAVDEGKQAAPSHLTANCAAGQSKGGPSK